MDPERTRQAMELAADLHDRLGYLLVWLGVLTLVVVVGLGMVMQLLRQIEERLFEGDEDDGDTEDTEDTEDNK